MNNGGYLHIDQKVIETINQYRQMENDTPESGGFLCGYYKGLNLHVVDLTVPQATDIQSRFIFNRRDPGHVQTVRQWYISSGGEINCLGEWHTHPEEIPTPSYIDRNGWKSFGVNRNGQQAVFLIAGTKDIWIGSTDF